VLGSLLSERASALFGDVRTLLGGWLSSSLPWCGAPCRIEFLSL
jgi:hypothetical protein